MANVRKEKVQTGTAPVVAPPVDEKVDAKTSHAEDLVSSISQSVDNVTGSVAAKVVDREQDKVDLHEEIACKSIVFGGLTWISRKTNAHYRWNDIGDIAYIPFHELVAMNNSQRAYLFKPYIVVQDARVVNHFRLTETYEKVAKIQELDRAIATASMRDIENIIDTTLGLKNMSMRDIVISKVRDMRRNDTLNNINVIKLLEKKLGFDLSDDVEVAEN